MNQRDHERALELIAGRGVDEVSATDSAWLESHLVQCLDCAQYADDFDDAGRLLRSVAVTASPSLVRKTQARVQARALYLREQRSRVVLIAISFCIGAMSSALSAWLWWRFGGWVASHVGLPATLVQPGIALFLLLPAVVIAGLMLTFPGPVLEERFMAALARERERE